MIPLFTIQAQYIEHAIVIILAIFCVIQLIAANSKAKLHAKEAHDLQLENLKLRAAMKKSQNEYLILKERIHFTEEKLEKTERQLAKSSKPKVVSHKASNTNSHLWV